MTFGTFGGIWVGVLPIDFGVVWISGVNGDVDGDGAAVVDLQR